VFLLQQTVLTTVYWQKYGVDKQLHEPMFPRDLEAMSAKEVYAEISKACDKFERVNTAKFMFA
jgi:hypothetical protein